MKENRPICVVATCYAFLLYLIHHNIETIKKTFFVFDVLFPPNISKNVPNSYQFKKPGGNILFRNISYRWQIYKNLPKLDSHSVIYAQDHLLSSIIYLGKRDYIYIEDSAGKCAQFYNSAEGKKQVMESLTLSNRLRRFVYGPLYMKILANNDQATSLLLTKDDTSSYLDGKKRMILPAIDNNLWKSFPKEKQSIILDYFSVNEEVIAMLQGGKILLLTQPLAENKWITTEEQLRIYRLIMRNYDESKVIIKPHPRDSFIDYKNNFPSSYVLTGSFPSELFSLFDAKFSKVVTAFSTGVYSFSGKVPIDWYGCINEKLKSEYGNVVPPPNANLVKI